MIVFASLALALVIVGTSAARFLWRRENADSSAETTPLELIAAGTLLGVGIWISVNWVLALTQQLNAPALWLCLALCVVGATLISLREAKPRLTAQVSPAQARPLLALLPLLFWIIFILWRGAVLPPANHDVLAYHLPKAVMVMQAEGYQRLDAPDHRITNYPFNYELLLADILILTGSDRLTEWVGTGSFVALLLTAAALAQRWWGSSPAAIVATILATSSAPVLILHSGADKNDLMAAWLSLAALLWGARWVSRGGRVSLFLTMIALAMGVGTKATVAAVGFGLAPFLAWRLVRELRSGDMRPRALAALAVVAAVAFVLCGGLPYAMNFAVAHAAGKAAVTAGSAEALDIQYGDWNNLWQVPYLLLTIPFSRDANTVWVPWRQQYWFWPHYEIFFSHWGRLTSLLSAAVPLAVLWLRRTGAVTERAIATAGALIAAMIMLPTQLRPLGFFGAFARYIAFLIPIIVCWTIPPLFSAAARRTQKGAAALLGAVALVFSIEAAICAVHDRFSPLEYALFAAEHPGTRVIWFTHLRAGSIVDRLAGPADKIAVDGSFDTWVYPAYGSQLTREVIFLPQGTLPHEIPPDVQWIMIDRSWDALWSHPKLTDLGQIWSYIGKGEPTPEDVFLFNALSNNSSFELVYRNQVSNQAVFRRLRAPLRREPDSGFAARSGTMPPSDE